MPGDERMKPSRGMLRRGVGRAQLNLTIFARGILLLSNKTLPSRFKLSIADLIWSLLVQSQKSGRTLRASRALLGMSRLRISWQVTISNIVCIFPAMRSYVLLSPPAKRFDCRCRVRYHGCFPTFAGTSIPGPGQLRR